MCPAFNDHKGKVNWGGTTASEITELKNNRGFVIYSDRIAVFFNLESTVFTKKNKFTAIYQLSQLAKKRNRFKGYARQLYIISKLGFELVGHLQMATALCWKSKCTLANGLQTS